MNNNSITAIKIDLFSEHYKLDKGHLMLYIE